MQVYQINISIGTGSFISFQGVTVPVPDFQQLKRRLFSSKEAAESYVQNINKAYKLLEEATGCTFPKISASYETITVEGHQP